MNTEQLNQALRMTISEISTTSTNSMIESNILSIQLDEQREENQRLQARVDEQREENQRLQARVDELEALLDEQTKPADKGE
ncbi:hypothetical protein RK945_07795 [Streptococcus pneumoniae]|nr:hypothetical protein [Streptococcus pneumoniae]MDS2258297.1 hypothetical protein [Streptococcus pneumoniae]MDS2318832.1 hypothetical protein [Streptococcus pneumoniae]MDS2481136.1 hypothetical protein [Streptococcus pneumoniae]MDS2882761.1 hypothetical protein [Streptococcus pneumoniae]MDS2911784.1 hypothetical protein [Streptococcus pneumoniae]